MNDREFATIASAIKAAWPSANIMPDKQSKEVWYTMLADFDYPICLNAVKQLMSTNIFPPSIAEIRQKYLCIREIPEKDWGDAWKSVQKAIGSYGYMREEEAMESFDERTRITVKRLGWRNICHSENIVADRANFRMIYEAMQKSDRESKLLPKNVQLQQERLRKLSSGVVEKLEGNTAKICYEGAKKCQT